MTWPVIDRASWLKLLDLGPIYDEYDRLQDRDEFLAFIEAKQDGISQGSPRAVELSSGYYGLSDHDFTVDGYDFSNAVFS